MLTLGGVWTSSQKRTDVSGWLDATSPLVEKFALGDEPREDQSSDEQAVPVCPACFAPVRPEAPFCDDCGAPSGAFATYDPMQQIYATGWLYRRAISSGISTMALIGMWILFGFGLVQSLFWVVLALAHPTRLSTLGWISVLTLLAFAVVQAAILQRVTARYLVYRRERIGHCGKCSYDLRGAVTPTCPECGTPFDLASVQELHAGE